MAPAPAAPTLVLVIQTPTGSPREIDLATVRFPCTLGRDRDLSQVIIPDGQASRAHCTLTRQGDRLLIEDLESRNGTWVKGQRVTKAVLHPGDSLTIGATEVTFAVVEPPDPLVGRRIAGFDLLEVMGRGSYGTVYRALQVNLQRPVAVKILSEECAKDPKRVEAFLVESRRAGRMNHPHLVQVHDVLQAEGRHLLIMELMTATAGELLADEGPFGPERLLMVLRDITRALAFAESQRLVHRDVKPDNILVNDEDLFKLADLGIATPISADGLAQQERAFGSPHYVAPEQARGGAIDGRADLYALGASLWHLATGKTLFEGNPRQLVTHHCTTPVPDLRKLAPQLPLSVVTIIYRLLEKTPDRRPANAAEANRLAEQALAALSNRGVATAPAQPRRLMARRRLRRIR